MIARLRTEEFSELGQDTETQRLSILSPSFPPFSSHSSPLTPYSYFPTLLFYPLLSDSPPILSIPSSPALPIPLSSPSLSNLRINFASHSLPLPHHSSSHFQTNSTAHLLTPSLFIPALDLPYPSFSTHSLLHSIPFNLPSNFPTPFASSTSFSTYALPPPTSHSLHSYLPFPLLPPQCPPSISLHRLANEFENLSRFQTELLANISVLLYYDFSTK